MGPITQRDNQYTIPCGTSSVCTKCRFDSPYVVSRSMEAVPKFRVLWGQHAGGEDAGEAKKMGWRWRRQVRLVREVEGEAGE